MTAGVYLAFDFGTQRIGVAVGDAVTRSARALCTIPQDWKQIERLIKEWGPAACVVGLPLDREGEEQAITRKARGFASDLGRRFSGPVHLCDERYSSRSAQDDLRGARSSGALKRRVRIGDKDSAAARLILQQWLDESRESGIENRESEKTK
ncbi:MAG: Holliday junction resolvase RuvX [Hydrocarboniphaga effusa]|nr:Holliday junction resolvase RuvX [Hydrocarboniphaga effusa]